MIMTILNSITRRKSNYICILIAIGIYVINKIWLIENTHGELQYFCQCYLNDLVCPLFFIGFSQILLIWAENEMVYIRQYILFIVVYGLIWEYIAPLINPKAVTDVKDIWCYLLGMLVYYVLWKNEHKNVV